MGQYALFSRIAFAACVMGVVLVSSTAIAQPQTETQSAQTPAPKPRDEAHARELFRRGMALFHAGDLERAAALLIESHRTFASKGNSVNAAICLQRLGREDEALELYEEALTRFDPEVDAADRTAVQAVIQRLRARLGALDVSANVAGAIVVVDGRERGRTPLRFQFA